MTPPGENRQGPAVMTDDHKAALSRGRDESRVVKTYLDAQVANKPKRGRKRTKESIDRRLSAIETELVDATPIKALQLVQERLDLTAELVTIDDKIDMSGLEDAFVEVAAGYGSRKGISYAAWREIGVDAAVLKRSGIKHTS
jgi:hypothetical protein